MTTEGYVFLLSLTALAIYAFLIALLYMGWHRLSIPSPSTNPPHSVIVACRNEEKNIPLLIRSLANQHTPPAEFIFVDHCSYDRTFHLLLQLSITLPSVVRLLRFHSLPAHATKKHAIHEAILHTRTDTLLLTDADCQPPPQWTQTMATACPREGMAVGFSPLVGGGWVGKMLFVESILIMFKYGGAGGWGKPYMAVGRNLAYHKHLYIKAGTHKPHMHIPSGDDDLLLQLAFRIQAPIRIVASPQATVPSRAPATFCHALKRKLRHMQTFAHYLPLHRALIALFWVGWGLSLISTLGLTLFKPLWGIALLTARQCLSLVWLSTPARTLQLSIRQFSVLLPALEISLLFFYCLALICQRCPVHLTKKEKKSITQKNSTSW